MDRRPALGLSEAAAGSPDGLPVEGRPRPTRTRLLSVYRGVTLRVWLYGAERPEAAKRRLRLSGDDPSRKAGRRIRQPPAGFVPFESGAAPQAVKAKPCGRFCRYPHLSPGRKTGLPRRLRRPPGGRYPSGITGLDRPSPAHCRVASKVACATFLAIKEVRQ